jgi:hypothetical protein
MFGADDSAIEEVKIEETMIRNTSPLNFERSIRIRSLEIAVHKWLMDMYSSDYTITSNDRGFPDFVMTDTEGKKIGVEVKVIRFNRDVSYILHNTLSKA